MEQQQYSLFPEPQEDAHKTLYVIGNGFDLAHGIKSNYSDFHKWLNANGHSRLVRLLEIFFNNDENLWKDIEYSLGRYNEEQILSFCSPNEIDYEHPMRYANQVEDSPTDFFLPVLDEFNELFHKWVNEIDISNAKPMLRLLENSKYLTFNYTDLLESVYHIPSSQILHIHGNRLNNKEYLLGHNNYREPSDAWSDEELLFNCHAYECIIRGMNDYVKTPSRVIDKFIGFFEQLSHIKKVVVVGHSLNEIDMPYFAKIKSVIKENASWFLSWHNLNDLINTQSFVKKLGLSVFTSFKL